MTRLPPIAAERLSIRINDTIVECEAGASVASVLLSQDFYLFSLHPADHSPRGAFCMMGACQACRVLIDNRWRQACQVRVAEGMRVQLELTGDHYPSTLADESWSLQIK